MSAPKRGGRKVNSLRKRAMSEFLSQSVDYGMIKYLADRTRRVIRCHPSPNRERRCQSASCSFSPSFTYPRQRRTTSKPQAEQIIYDEADVAKIRKKGPPLEDFISHLVKKSNVQVPTLMSTLVYLERLRLRLSPVTTGVTRPLQRIFLAALIISSKYFNDSSPKNKHWAIYSNLYPESGFELMEVNIMEKQLLDLLDWDLRVSNKDLFRTLEPFITPICDIIFQRDHVAASSFYIPNAYPDPVRDVLPLPPRIHSTVTPNPRRGPKYAIAPNKEHNNRRSAKTNNLSPPPQPHRVLLRISPTPPAAAVPDLMRSGQSSVVSLTSSPWARSNLTTPTFTELPSNSHFPYITGSSNNHGVDQKFAKKLDRVFNLNTDHTQQDKLIFCKPGLDHVADYYLASETQPSSHEEKKDLLQSSTPYILNEPARPSRRSRGPMYLLSRLIGKGGSS